MPLMARPSATAPEAKLNRLLEVIRPRTRLLTAFSGGTDSTLVAAAARQALGRDNAPAALGDSASLPRRELAQARDVAAQLDLDLLEINPGEQDDPHYQRNAGDRCFFCKTNLYDALHQLAQARQIPFIANGANVDDLADHRPGLQAARAAQVVSPLLEAELTKQDVRDIARHLNLPNWNKPAAACLASRIPYGTPVTPQRLAQVEQAEDALHELGFSNFRVRHHEHVARIELPWEQATRLADQDLRGRVVSALQHAGYQFVTLDLAGFRSGSGNVLLHINGEKTGESG